MIDMKGLLLAIPLVSLGCLTQACDVQYQQTLTNSPSKASLTEAFLGEWRSAGPASFVTPQTCGDLRWNVTSQDATHVTGQFDATCAGGVALTGTATGFIDGALRFQAVGTATGLGPVSCPFTLDGTGTPQADATLRMDYTGTTCLGAISGTEILRR
jgi:hypothetical protein